MSSIFVSWKENGNTGRIRFYAVVHYGECGANTMCGETAQEAIDIAVLHYLSRYISAESMRIECGQRMKEIGMLNLKICEKSAKVTAEKLEKEIRACFERMSCRLACEMPFSNGQRFKALSQYGYTLCENFNSIESAEAYTLRYYMENMNLIRQ